jgi:ankyrin repeat protein
MAMMRLIAAIVVMTLVACDTGPGALPQPPTPRTPSKWGPSDIDLAKRNADWFESDSNDPFPLDKAIRTNRLDEVRRLLEAGANPNLRWGRSGDRFPLQAALDSGGNIQPDPRELVPLLIEHGANPNAKWCPYESRGTFEWGPGCTSARGSTALHFAAMQNSRQLVEQLLAAGADPTARDWANASALDFAYDEVVFETISRALFPEIATRNKNALAWLKEYDGRFYGANAWESTPLSRALGQTDRGFVPLPPSALTSEGGSQEDYRTESEGRLLARVRSLIRIGADPNERATRGDADWTPLAMALHQGARRAARFLLQNGASPDERTCVALIHGSFSAKWTHGTPFQRHPDCTQENGLTPLMDRARREDREGVQLLLEFKADRSLKDWAGRSALDYAKDRVVRDLLSVR